MAHVSPHAALACARLLRAFHLASRQGGLPVDYLDIADPRTAEKLFEKAGVARDAGGLSARQFMQAQRLVDASICDGVLRLLEMSQSA